MVAPPPLRTRWCRSAGERIDLPLTGSGEYQCPHTGDRYLLEGDRVSRRPA